MVKNEYLVYLMFINVIHSFIHSLVYSYIHRSIHLFHLSIHSSIYLFIFYFKGFPVLLTLLDSEYAEIQEQSLKSLEHCLNDGRHMKKLYTVLHHLHFPSKEVAGQHSVKQED